MPRMVVLYEVIFYLVFIFFIPCWVLAGVIQGKPRNLAEKLGFYRDRPGGHDIWIHAVSVGEVVAARAIIDRLMELRPETRVVLSSTTVTGQMTARRLFPGLTIAHFPFDMAWVVRRFLRQYGPRVYATMETEIWPTVSRVASAEGVRMVLANGRISDRSLPRYRIIRSLIADVLGRYEWILARHEADRERFIAIGAPADRVTVTGNVKFDFEPDESPLAFAAELERLAKGRPIFALGSTVDGEDEILVPAFEEMTSRGIFLVVAPRKPERFEAVAALLDQAKLRWVRRTALGDDDVADILLLDTIGELPKVYGLAKGAFIGGSLLPRGGHNPIEPAAVGTPVAFGPHMSNFREVATMLLNHHAAVQLDTPASLVAFAIRMTSDADAQNELSNRCREAVQKNRGAALRTAERIVGLLK